MKDAPASTIQNLLNFHNSSSIKTAGVSNYRQWRWLVRHIDETSVIRQPSCQFPDGSVLVDAKDASSLTFCHVISGLNEPYDENPQYVA